MAPYSAGSGGEAGTMNPRKELDRGIVHDCFTLTELLHYQNLRLCQPGEEADLIREGMIAAEEEFPLNTLDLTG